MLSLLSFDFPRICVVCVLLIPLFSKRKVPLVESDLDSYLVKLLLGFIDSVHLPFTLTLCYLILGSTAVWAPYLGILMLNAMILVGFLLEKFKILSTCNCYGNFSKDATNLTNALRYILLFCNIVLLVGWTNADHDSAIRSSEGATLTYVGLIFIAVVIANWFDIKNELAFLVYGREFNAEKSASQVGLVTPKKYFPHSLLIGNDRNGQQLFLEDLAETAPLILFVVLSNTCAPCRRIKPLFFRLANTFRANLKTIFVLADATSFDTESDGLNLVHGSEEFFAATNNENYPFCFVLNTHDLSQVGEVSYSGSSIWESFYRILSITVKS